MAVLTKTDSEVSSLSQSSPPYSPRRPIYYVQSSSRDSSHDGEKTTNSFHSSPLQSPLGSPPHSHSNSSLGRHSRESASTRFSGSRKSSSTNRKGLWRPWKDHFHAIKEEGLLDAHDNAHHGFPRRCYFLAFILAFLLLFSSFSLILWAASRPQKPAISLKVHSSKHTLSVIIYNRFHSLHKHPSIKGFACSFSTTPSRSCKYFRLTPLVRLRPLDGRHERVRHRRLLLAAAAAPLERWWSRNKGWGAVEEEEKIWMWCGDARRRRKSWWFARLQI